MYCILDKDNNVVPCDLETWGEWFSAHDRCVKLSIQDDTRVSTVFLGIDHGFGETPLWFETMVFMGPDDWLDRDTERYTTWDEAVEGHGRMVAKVFKPTPILALPK